MFNALAIPISTLIRARRRGPGRIIAAEPVLLLSLKWWFSRLVHRTRGCLPRAAEKRSIA